MRRIAAALLLLPLLPGWSAPCTACDTPVYRYAMYNWPPHPYQVVYLYRDEIPADDKPVHQALLAAEDDAGQPANLRLMLANLDDPEALADLPAPQQAALEQFAQAGLPRYVVFSPPSVDAPAGLPVYTGSLSAADVAALLDSPARQRILKALGEARHGVLLVLAGSDAEQNQAAVDTARQVAADAQAGKIQPFTAPGSPLLDPPDEAPAEPDSVSLAVVTVGRDDPAEAWLVRMLLAVESDLHEFDEPMVFAIFGRGRVAPPYIGRGITADNVAEVVSFLTGSCSCEVKEQVPGNDLLLACNWDEVARRLARQVGEEEGNEALLADDFPLIVGSDTPTTSTPPDQTPATDSADTRAAATSTASLPTVAAEDEASTTASRGRKPNLPRRAAAAPDASVPSEAAGLPDSPGTLARVWQGLAVALGTVLLGLAVVSFVVLYRRTA